MPVRIALVRLSFAVGWAFLSSLSVSAETRTWIDSTGKYKIEADFLKIEEGQVYLQRTDGKKLNLPLAKLSKDDQAYLKDLMKRRRNGESEDGNPFQEAAEGGPGFGADLPREALNEIQRQLGRRGFPLPSGFGDDEPQYKVGDQVEVQNRGRWQVGEIVGFDTNGHSTFVKLTDGSMVDAYGSFSIRPYDPTLGPLARVPEDQLARVDTTRIRRIVPLGGAEGDFKPDPVAAAKPDWKPTPVGLNPKTNSFSRVVDVSFSKGGTTAAVGHADQRGGRDGSLSQIELCDLKSGRVKAVVRGPRALEHMATSPSGQRLITISEQESFVSGPLQLWELGDDELKHVKSWNVNSGERGKKIEWIGWVDDERVLTLNRNSLTMWSIDRPRGVYQITGQGLNAPTLSPGGKQIAVGSETGVTVHDVGTGELLTRIPMSHSFIRRVAFSPSGKLLAVSGSSTLDVYDLTTGKKTVDAYAASAGSNKGLSWLDEEHVLVGGSNLIHLPSQMTVWNYQHHAESVVQLADRMWYVFAEMGNESMALLPFDLPHAAVKPVSDSELVLKPGDEVSIQMELSIDLGVDAQGNPVSVQDQLTAALKEAGFKVVDHSEKKLIARTLSGETKEIEYRMFGAGFRTEKANYAQRVLELELIVDGESVWKRRRVMDAPFHLQLKENETVDQALNRVLTADTGFFRSTVPSRILPAAAEKARTSTLSINGLQ
jgi:WD40 repeat protein